MCCRHWIIDSRHWKCFFCIADCWGLFWFLRDSINTSATVFINQRHENKKWSRDLCCRTVSVAFCRQLIESILESKNPPWFLGEGFLIRAWRWPTFTLVAALSSAQSRFTVLFGMGRGGTNSLWSSGINCSVVCSQWGNKQRNLEEVKMLLQSLWEVCSIWAWCTTKA